MQSYDNYLEHHGVKGQKWGVRRYQNLDGSLTAAGRIHRGYVTNDNRNRVTSTSKQRIANFVVSRYGKIKISQAGRGSDIGKKYADTWLSKDLPLYRVQATNQFENFAFFATYKNQDVNKYAGLFGKNLISRANAAAKAAARGSDADVAEKARHAADSMKVYQLQLKSTARLKVPSEENAANITGKLLKDKAFHDDLKLSLADSASKMKRPSQQLLFKEAAKVMQKDPASLRNSEKAIIYKALNLTLTNHNDAEVRMQSKFYGEMKKYGYSALLDLNDKSYSSYHAKSPVIVFDTTKVKLQSVTNMDPDTIEALFKKHNRQRIRRDIPEQIVGTLLKCGNIKISKIADYSTRRMMAYLGA